MLDESFELPFSDKGSGPIVVLLHGFLESYTMWNILGLDQIFRTIAIDLPGHGNAHSLPTITSISHMAACVEKTLKKLGVLEFSLIGHSMGAYVALELINRTNNCLHFVMLNSNFWTDDAKKKADRLRVAHLALHSKNFFVREAIPGLFTSASQHSEFIEALVQEALMIPGEHIAACSVAMRNRKDHRKTLEKNAQKISIFQGELDKLCPIEKMDKLLAGLKIKYVKIPSAGHMSHVENSTFVLNKLLKILLNGKKTNFHCQ